MLYFSKYYKEYFDFFYFGHFKYILTTFTGIFRILVSLAEVIFFVGVTNPTGKTATCVKRE